MTRPRDTGAQLQAAIVERRAVVVAGTGVSIAATRGHPEAGWGGLLKNGLAWLREHDLISETVASAHLSLIDSHDAETHHFVSAAQDITRQMGGRASVHFKRWLEETVGTLTAEEVDGLEALHALRAYGNLLATTNYDGLLLAHGGLTAVVWSDYDDLLEVWRHKQTDRVLFLHGYWRRPESVVLDWTSYDRVTRDEKHREQLSAFWLTSTWVYVGCGVNGLADPDLGLLLERYGHRLRAARLWDYCLVRRDQEEEFQAHFDANDLNLVAVGFGDSHAELPGYLRSLLPVSTPGSSERSRGDRGRSVHTGPRAPNLYAVPDYVAGHEFVGRASELRDLDDWAQAADPTNLLLFEAVGGSGKSMLTWKWVNDHAPVVRTDWAGRFWYSFYERGAVMADFCRHALSYMTGAPRGGFEATRTPKLASLLLEQLHAKPWLLVLDGLERVLVAYHRIDAAEVPDEEADHATDIMLDRPATDTIRDEDGDLLRRLAAASPSKILVSSRVTPRILLNPASQPIPGTKRLPLGGLRPEDAEEMFRASGVHGDSDAIRRYLTAYCDNHPLVIGVLAGLVTNYLPARGDFDAWVNDEGPNGGARLNLAKLDLVQRKHHILSAALDDLPSTSRELLSILALCPESIDHKTLVALNPFLPPAPQEVPQLNAADFEERSSWLGDRTELEGLPDERELAPWWEEYRQEAVRRHERDVASWEKYQSELAKWRQSPAVEEAGQTLTDAVRDLEQRGLLQYDGGTRRYDLHPVVRGVASGRLRGDDLQRHGQRVIDVFSSAVSASWDHVRTLEDVGPAVHLMRTLLKLERYDAASEVWREGDLDVALYDNLEAHAETLVLLRPFFARDWTELRADFTGDYSPWVMTGAAAALQGRGDTDAALGALCRAAEWCVAGTNLAETCTAIRNVVWILNLAGRLAAALRVTVLSLDLATALEREAHVFSSRRQLYTLLARLGRWEEAADTWRSLDEMGRQWPRATYRPGSAELEFAYGQYYQGLLREEHLTIAARLAADARVRIVQREVHRLRGKWRLEQRDWARATASFAEAVRMARERGIHDATAEAGLVLGKLQQGLLTPDQARAEALLLKRERRSRDHRLLAMIWHEVGESAEAQAEAIAEYEEAWADGEPYVSRFQLSRATELLAELEAPVPALPQYDASSDEPFRWEADVTREIVSLRTARPDS